jgi:hypothetical protein
LTVSCFVYSEESLFDDNFQKASEQTITTPINVTFLNGQLTIVNAPINSKVEIFTMLGVSIFRNVTVEQKQVFLLDLNKGYYIIKVGSETKKISVK